MAILTDTDILKKLSEDIHTTDQDALVICPFEKKCLSPTGYYLRAGKTVLVDGEELNLEKEKFFILKPQQTAMVFALENIRMPASGMISGIVQSKFSLVAQGLSNVSTALDYDWEGHLNIVIQNVMNKSVKIKYGEQLCRIIFLDNSSVPAMHSDKNEESNRALICMFSDIMHGARRRKKYFLISSLSVVGFAFALGFGLWGNSPGWGVTTALGVTVSQYIYLRK